jgi:broad specificity phosphatase PhoE
MEEQDIGEHMARAQIAMEVPACLGARRSAESEPRTPPLVAGEKAQAADEFTQHFRGVVLAALHEDTELMATEGVRDVVVVFHGVTASACPGVAEGGEHADTHVNAGGVLEGLVAQAEGGRVDEL